MGAGKGIHGEGKKAKGRQGRKDKKGRKMRRGNEGDGKGDEGGSVREKREKFMEGGRKVVWKGGLGKWRECRKGEG